MSAESCMWDIYLCLVEYCTTQDRCPKGNSLPLRPESVPAPNPICFLLSPCLRKFSAFCWVLCTNQTKTKELERFLTCPMVSSSHNPATVSNAKGQRSNCFLQHSQNGELGDQLPRPFTPTCSLTLTPCDQLCIWHHTCSDGDGTLISRGCSFHVISPSFFFL